MCEYDLLLTHRVHSKMRNHTLRVSPWGNTVLCETVPLCTPYLQKTTSPTVFKCVPGQKWGQVWFTVDSVGAACEEEWAWTHRIEYVWTGPVWLIWIGWCSGFGFSAGKKLRNSIPQMLIGRWQINRLFIALILTCCQNQPFSGSNSLTVIILELARLISPQKRKANLIFQKFFPLHLKKGSHNHSEIELKVSFIWLVQS